MDELIQTIKKAAVDAVNATCPIAIVFGNVEQADPLQIRIDQKLLLGMRQLILTKNVIGHEVEAANGGLKHVFEGDNGLRVNEGVILIRMQGGQKYVVLDRAE